MWVGEIWWASVRVDCQWEFTTVTENYSNSYRLSSFNSHLLCSLYHPRFMIFFTSMFKYYGEPQDKFYDPGLRLDTSIFSILISWEKLTCCVKETLTLPGLGVKATDVKDRFRARFVENTELRVSLVCVKCKLNSWFFSLTIDEVEQRKDYLLHCCNSSTNKGMAFTKKYHSLSLAAGQLFGLNMLPENTYLNPNGNCINM